ncbi:MAG: S9 family peptidase [Chloroflexi bacterium]|nr:S9 family peptidase [Chloroflexota bacterium]
MTDFTFDHFLSIPRLSALRLSPDGGRLLVAIARPAPDGKKMASSLWEVDAGGIKASVRLTRSAPGESGGAFVRDGSIVFTSSRPDPDARDEDKDDEEETSRLWCLPAGGGEARVIAAPPGGVDAVVTARDADVIAFAAAQHPGAAGFKADRERQKARKDAGVQAQLFESYPIRYWDHYLGPRERRLFAAPLPEAEDARIEEPVDVTPGTGHGLEDMAFDITPDGTTVVTSWLDAEEITRIHADLIAIDRGTGARRILTAGDGWYTEPRCSPDGRSVVCARADLGSPDIATNQTLWLVDLASGEGRDLTPDLDLWPHAPAWAPDGSAVFFLADRLGHSAVFRAEVGTGEVTMLAAEGAYSDLCPSADGGELFALRASLTSPPAVVRIDAREAEQQPRVVPSPVGSEDGLGIPGVAEQLVTTAEDGREIRSWLVRPRAASSESPAPLVVWIHGGPLSSWNSWSWRWNPHLLIQRGYAVLLPDPALSTGYGQDFIQRGWGRWGKEPFSDIMAAVDGALKRDDLDAERTAAMGGSFGGYMANWVAGQTDRFRAIVTHASLWELRGFHGTTDLGPEWEKEFGDPYADPSRYEEESPDRHVGNIRTPMLVIHGERDHRVPISEGLRLWTDLRRHGVEAKFLYYPDENHWILKPPNARVWYETVFSFLDQHVLGQEWQRPKLL